MENVVGNKELKTEGQISDMFCIWYLEADFYSFLRYCGKLRQ